MFIKIVKTHTVDTRAAAMEVVDSLRDKCIPCSDPTLTPHGNEDRFIYRVEQYVRTEYPEI